MAEAPIVAVRGEAVLEVDPEVATVGVAVSARDPDRAKTLNALNERVTRVQTVVKGFGDAVERVETSAVRVSPQLKGGKPRERVAGYVAVVQHNITVVGFDHLGELLAQVSDQEMTEVTGPWWRLRDGSPVHRRAREAAVHDAVQRAREYASALGSQLVGLVELADARLLSEGPVVAMAAGAPRGMALGRRETGPDEFTFDIEPAKQTVRATVEARFRIAEPDLSQA
jgi:uncharacterized protein YggE